MKQRKVADIFYRIGRVLAYIGLVASVILIVLGIVMIVNKDSLATNKDMPEEYYGHPDKIAAAGVVLLIYFIFYAGLEIVGLIFVSKARRDLKSGSNSIKNHLIVTILSILFFGIFYLIGGIFGLVSCKEEPKAE